MSSTENGASTRRCPVWVKGLLVVSLAANVIVLGLVAGQALKGHGGGDSPDRQVRWIIRLVPENRRDETRAHFREIRDDMRALGQARNERMTDIVDAIRVQPFSEETLQGALGDRRAATLERRVLVQDRLVSLLSGFTDEERATFADNLDDYLKRLEERQERR